MQDVYVLLHKSEQDYAFVVERIDQKDAEIESEGNMIQALQDGYDERISRLNPIIEK